MPKAGERPGEAASRQAPCEVDAKSDELVATGTLGGEMFNQFFAKYDFKLALEHGDAARRAVAGTAVVSELENYCRQQVRC